MWGSKGHSKAETRSKHQFGVFLLGGYAGGSVAGVLRRFGVQGVVARDAGGSGLLRGDHVARAGSDRLEDSGSKGSGVVDSVMCWGWG